ncbi:hypothetical protein CBL_11363 [Carabus blaptoides fortunei]
MGYLEVANYDVLESTVSRYHCQRQWQRDDNARAARLIGTALDEEATSNVRKKTEAKEIWDTLVSVFEQSSLQRLYTLTNDFFEVTKDDATSVTNTLRDAQKRSSNSSQSAASLNSSTKGTPSNTPTTKKKETCSCLYCKKVGHVIADFRKRADAEQVRKEADSKPDIFFAVGLTAKNNFVAADSWIADSGASHNMTANKQHFGYIKVDVYVDDRWSSASLNSVCDGCTVLCNNAVVATGDLVGNVCVMNIRVHAPKTSAEAKTTLELWSGKTFDRIDYLRIFDSECYVNVLKKFRSKFDDKAVLGHFVVELYLNHHDEEQSTDDRSVSEYSDECDDEFNNDQPSSQPNRPARETCPPARLNDYEIDYQAHRSKNSALACLKEAVREELVNGRSKCIRLEFCQTRIPIFA